MLPYSHRTVPVPCVASMEMHSGTSLCPPNIFSKSLISKKLRNRLKPLLFGSITAKHQCYKQMATASNLWAEAPPLGETSPEPDCSLGL